MSSKEPLPIWFFVGLVLGVYGLLVILAGLIGGPANTPLAHKLVGNFLATNPGLWWGGLMFAAGVIFTVVGLWSQR